MLISLLNFKNADMYKMLALVSSVLSILGAVGFFVKKGMDILKRGYVYGRLEKFLEKNVFVKDIKTLSDIGKIKAVLADKTGVFTDSRFAVYEVSSGDGEKVENFKNVSEEFLKEVCISAGMNNSSNAGNMVAVGGEKTDRAIYHI